MIPTATLTAVESSETFGLPACDVRLIAKLRQLDPALLAQIRGEVAA